MIIYIGNKIGGQDMSRVCPVLGCAFVCLQEHIVVLTNNIRIANLFTKRQDKKTTRNESFFYAIKVVINNGIGESMKVKIAHHSLKAIGARDIIAPIIKAII